MKRRILSPSDTNYILNLKKEIELLYSRVLYNESRSDYRKKYFSEALLKINDAILKNPEEKYLKHRDIVLKAREEYQLKKEIEEEKEQERNEKLLARKNAGITSGFDLVRLYYKEIEPQGLHLSYTTGVEISPDLEIGHIDYWISGDIFLLQTYKTDRNVIHKMWTLGVNGRYVEVSEDKYQLGYDSGYLLGLTAGVTGGLEFKYYKNMGVFLQGRMDFEYYPQNPEYSGLQPRISAGLIF